MLSLVTRLACDPHIELFSLDMAPADICRRYSLSSKIFFSPPPGLCFTLSNDPILLSAWISIFLSIICNIFCVRKLLKLILFIIPNNIYSSLHFYSLYAHNLCEIIVAPKQRIQRVLLIILESWVVPNFAFFFWFLWVPLQFFQPRCASL